MTLIKQVLSDLFREIRLDSTVRISCCNDRYDLHTGWAQL